MQVYSGFSVRRFKHDWSTGPTGMHHNRGCEGFQNASVQAEEEAGGSNPSGYKDIRNISATISIKKILAAISRRSHIQLEVLTGRKRNKIIMPWRQLAYLLSYELTGCTLTQIGKVLNRDHTSLMHGIKQINKLRQQDQYVEHIYRELRRELSGV